VNAVVRALAPPAAIGFDFDHTLGLDNGLENIAFYRLAAEAGLAISERDRVWAVEIADALARFRAGAIGLEEMVARFIARVGAPVDPMWAERYREICYGLVDVLVTPIPGARELLAALAQSGIHTAILTNGWSPLQNLKIHRALDYRRPILVSGELGILKPAAAAFGKLVDVLDAPRERVWYVGDNPTVDVAGAHGAGLRSVWFDWEQVAYPAGAPPPDVRIGRLPDLLDLLRGAGGVAQNRSG
jgi:putative hydrolase of the HAD superfamily